MDEQSRQNCVFSVYGYPKPFPDDDLQGGSIDTDASSAADGMDNQAGSSRVTAAANVKRITQVL
jgi:hypothetical protein